MTEHEEQANKLVACATEYAKDKAVESVLKKRLDSNNKTIKALMELLKQDSVTTKDGDIVCYSVRTKDDLDEEALIKVLHKLAPETNCIKTKEYIDMDILENEIYHGVLSDETLQAMDKCKTVKEIPTLTIKKAKKEK